VRTVFLAAAAVVVVMALCGCGASGAQWQIRQPVASGGAIAQTHKSAGVLYVDDGDNHAVDILKNGTWKEVGSITYGIGDIDRNWVDGNGNFYFAQFSPVEIVEYAPGASSPTFTYDSQMQLPVDVTTDPAGNVYEADELTSSVNEYPQQTNAVSATCGNSLKLFLSVAVDASGDVFVGYLDNQPYGKGHIYEYRGGLSGCHATELGVTLDFPGGMALDKKGNIVICDVNDAVVDIVPPPYNSISRTLGSGLSGPFSVRINKRNDRAYVADDGQSGPSEVFVLRYPSGSLIKKLGSKKGVAGTLGAVDSDNFNP
jgi:hypothetical protein